MGARGRGEREKSREKCGNAWLSIAEEQFYDTNNGKTRKEASPA